MQKAPVMPATAMGPECNNAHPGVGVVLQPQQQLHCEGSPSRKSLRDQPATRLGQEKAHGAEPQWAGTVCGDH